MNKVNYDQTGGFPLDVNILDFGQKANQISQQLGEIIAPLAIVKGCLENGNNVGDGLVFIDGELLPFVGGLKQAQIRIVETAETREFENIEVEKENKDVLITRYATFGIGATKSYNWADFYRSITIKEIEKRLVQVGFIQDFYGDISKIPLGWYLCDGTNGTPDLRGMFVVGYDSRTADYNQIGKTGGAKDVTLSVNQMPKHKFSGTTSVSGKHSHSYIAPIWGESGSYGRGNNGKQDTYTTTESGDHSHTFETNELGNSESHENRPPFYVLAKIMYKG